MKNFIVILCLVLAALQFSQAMMPSIPDTSINQNSRTYDSIMNENCSICISKFMTEYTDGRHPDNVVFTPCKHAFHKSCINQFMGLNKNDIPCPLCKNVIKKDRLISGIDFEKLEIPSNDEDLAVVLLAKIETNGIQSVVELILKLERVDCIQKCYFIKEYMIENIYDSLKYAIACDKPISVLALVALHPKLGMDSIGLMSIVATSKFDQMASIVSKAFENPSAVLIQAALSEIDVAIHTEVIYGVPLKLPIVSALNKTQFTNFVVEVEKLEYNDHVHEFLRLLAFNRNFIDSLSILASAAKLESNQFGRFMHSLIQAKRPDIVAVFLPNNYSDKVRMEQWLYWAIESNTFECFSVLLSSCSNELLGQLHHIFDVCVRRMPYQWARQMRILGYSFANASDDIRTNMLTVTIKAKDFRKVEFLLSGFSESSEILKKVFRSYLKERGNEPSIISLFIEKNPLLSELVYE